MKTLCCLLSQYCGQASIVDHERTNGNLAKNESLVAGPDECICDLFDLAFGIIEVKLVESGYSEGKRLLNERNEILLRDI